MSESTTTYVDPDVMVDEEVTESASVESLTTYAAVKRVNEWLARDGYDKELPGPMLYNYTVARVRKGDKPFIPVTEDNKIKVSDLEVWYAKYIAKNGSKFAKA